VIGSAAGILAWLRPAIESKHKEDMKRAAAILAKFEEIGTLELPDYVYLFRKVPGWCLRPFDGIKASIAENRQEVRFIGPLRRHLRSELEQMILAYDEFRKFVQVPWWQPEVGVVPGTSDWKFEKAAFESNGKMSDKYAHHLSEAAAAADLVKLRFQRFQALTELHFFESLIPRIFVRRKFTPCPAAEPPILSAGDTRAQTKASRDRPRSVPSEPPDCRGTGGDRGESVYQCRPRDNVGDSLRC